MAAAASIGSGQGSIENDVLFKLNLSVLTDYSKNIQYVDDMSTYFFAVLHLLSTSFTTFLHHFKGF